MFLYLQSIFPDASGRPPSNTPHYVAFMLRADDCATPIRVNLGPAAPIDDDVRRFRAALSRDTHDLNVRILRGQYRKSMATRLAEKILPPALRAAISGKSRLIVAPDGAMALLPFRLLPVEEGHEFFLETRTISYIPSGRDLVHATGKKPTSISNGLLAIGAPTFDTTPTESVKARTARAGCGTVEEPFLPLPGTQEELQAISSAARKASRAEPVTMLEGAHATKAAFLEQAPKARVLHLATHAYFAEEECLPVGFVEAPPRTMDPDALAFLGHNPFLLSGIAFAGANEREKADGILTALEITAMDLRNADLVVLSACDTGLGTLARGQELLGLRRAFAYAGAKNLVTSLCSVPDEETQP